MSTFTYIDFKPLYAFKCKWTFRNVKLNVSLFIMHLISISLLFFLSPLTSSGQIGTGGTAGDFEIDANFRVNNTTTPLKDWRSVLTLDPDVTHFDQYGRYVIPGISNVTGENAKWITDGNTGSGSVRPETEVFKSGSNKNSDYINAGGSPYQIITVNPSAPQKNDITNVYARSKKINNKIWVALGAETRSTDGTSYLDFEYNQAGVNQTATNLIGLGPDGGRTAKKTGQSGDLLFVVDFVQGGQTPIPRMFEWQQTGVSKGKPVFGWVEITPLPAGSVYIVTNNADIETAGLNSGVSGEGAPSSITAALQFVEMGVNLTDLGLATDNPCSPDATLTCKTRSSASITSELKDFSSFKFSVAPPATLTDLSPQTKCPGDEASFSTTVGGDGASAVNVEWYIGTTKIIEDGTKYIITENGNTSTLTIKNLVSADGGTYKAKLVNATCGTPEETSTLTMNVTAALTDLSPQTKCPGLTAEFTTTVSGTGANGANVEWYKVVGQTETLISAGGRYSITTTSTTSKLTISNVEEADEATYKAKLVSATCGTPEKSSTLTVNENAALTNLSPQTKCPGEAESATFSTTVSGTGASAVNVEWYIGTTKIIEDGTKYIISENGNTSTLTINNIVEADEGTYKAKLVNATCNTPEKTSTLTVNSVPVADAGTDPAEQCYIAAGNVFNVGGTNTANGDALWTVVSPDPLPQGVTVDINTTTSFTPTVTVTGASAGITVTLKLTVTSNADPSCGSDEDEVVIKVKAQTQGQDGEIPPITCTDASFKLQLSATDAATSYKVTQPCNPDYSSTLSGNGGLLTFEGLKFGAGYKIVATKNGCEATPVICGGNDECVDICNTQAAITQVRSQEQSSSTIKGGTVETVNAKIGPSQTKVLAAPNPYESKVRFNLESAISGQGSLEIYNTLGQKIAIVYQGYIEKGNIKMVEFNVPDAQRANLIYVFKVGDQRVTGKLINLRF